MSIEFDKANRELEAAIKLHERLDKINDAILKDKDTLEELVKQLHTVNETIVPSAKKMVDNLISLRMTTGREIEYILQSCRNLKGLAQTQVEMKKYVDELLRLDDVLKNPRIADIVRFSAVALMNEADRAEKPEEVEK
jgi:hypothetical protein